jgi:hypothetical protein
VYSSFFWRAWLALTVLPGRRLGLLRPRGRILVL